MTQVKLIYRNFKGEAVAEAEVHAYRFTKTQIIIDAKDVTVLPNPRRVQLGRGIHRFKHNGTRIPRNPSALGAWHLHISTELQEWNRDRSGAQREA